MNKHFRHLERPELAESSDEEYTSNDDTASPSRARHAGVAAHRNAAAAAGYLIEAEDEDDSSSQDDCASALLLLTSAGDSSMSTPSHSVHTLSDRAQRRWDAPAARLSRVGASTAYTTPSPSHCTDVEEEEEDAATGGYAGKRGRGASWDVAPRRARARMDDAVFSTSASASISEGSDEGDEDAPYTGPVSGGRKRALSVASRGGSARPAAPTRKYSYSSTGTTSSAPREPVRRGEGNRERWQAARVIAFTREGALEVTPMPSLVAAFRFVYDAATAQQRKKSPVSESAQCSQMYSVLLRARGPGASTAHPAPTGVTYNHPLPTGRAAGSRDLVHYMVQLATEVPPADVAAAWELWVKNGDKQRESGHPPPHARPARLIAFSRGGHFDMTEYGCLTDTTRALHAATGRRREWRKLHNRVNNVLWTLGGVGGKTYQHPLTPPSHSRDALHFMVQYVSDEAPYDAESAAALWERSMDMQRYDAFSSSQKAAMERVADGAAAAAMEEDGVGKMPSLDGIAAHHEVVVPGEMTAEV